MLNYHVSRGLRTSAYISGCNSAAALILCVYSDLITWMGSFLVPRLSDVSRAHPTVSASIPNQTFSHSIQSSLRELTQLLYITFCSFRF